ncbi:MAG TPA: hypothetical protein VMS17_06550 [Gemmataceae bacterium]|nr:hypothetical protein [Gemmataceae bacterium]
MADYFLALDAADFEGRVRPALAASRRRASFDPCRALCAELISAARAYKDRYHVGGAEALVQSVADGMTFHRDVWRALVGEILLYTAVEIPEFQTCEATLVHLLAPGRGAEDIGERSSLPPIVQAHRGARDLTFGAAIYRPEQAAYNNAGDVARLTAYLATVRPERWSQSDLVGAPGAENEEEQEQELAFAREWFPALADLFRRAQERSWVLVHESIF